MSEPLNYQPSNSAVYYTPSKRLEIGRTIVGVTGASMIAALGAAIYSILQPDLESLLLRGGAIVAAALAAGGLSTAASRYGKVYSQVIAATIGSVIGLGVIYVMWLVWVHNIFTRRHVQIPWGNLVLHPILLLRLIQYFSTTGTWSYHGNVARGFGLLVFWFGESGAILSCAVLFPIWGIRQVDVTCRECGTKCKPAKKLPRFSTDLEREFVTAIENRDFAAILSHSGPRHEDDPEITLRLMSCPKCGYTHVLSVNRIAWIVDSKGIPKVNHIPLVRQLMVSPEEAEQFKNVCASVLEQRQQVEPPESAIPL